jgi:hypothetical protein
MAYVPKSQRVKPGNILLYKVISPSKVDQILKEGIKGSKTTCIHEPVPERKGAVYAYALETMKQLAARGFYLEDPVVIFETTPKGWFVGDLYKECSQKYKDTMRPLKDILEDPGLIRNYREMEVWLPKGYIPPEQIKAVKKLKDCI